MEKKTKVGLIAVLIGILLVGVVFGEPIVEVENDGNSSLSHGDVEEEEFLFY